MALLWPKDTEFITVDADIKMKLNIKIVSYK